MDFDRWLASDAHLLLLVDVEERMQALIEQALGPRYAIGVISGRFPLLGNLNVIENIALKAMYHRNTPLADVKNELSGFIQALDLEDVLLKRSTGLTEEELFNIYLLRCIANKDHIILFEQPDPWNVSGAGAFLAGVGLKVRLWVCCYRDEASKYARLNLAPAVVEG